MHNDIKTISLNSDGTNVEFTMSPVLNRIEQGMNRYFYSFHITFCILFWDGFK